MKRLSAVLLILSLALSASAAGGAVPRPDVGTKRLARVVDATSARYGIERRSVRAIVRAKLPAKLKRRLTRQLKALQACDALTRRAAAELREAGTDGLRGDSRRRIGAKYGERIRTCSVSVRNRAEALGRRASAGATSAARSRPLDLWPVLRYEPGDVDNTYLHDYALLLDRGGNDRYYNNAGGSVLDVTRGPAGSPAPTKEPAHGCEGGFDIVDPRLCVLGNAVLVDHRGSDGYGRLEPPRFDAYCTADPIERRFFVQGTGVAGVGVLVDRAGDDAYIGKTIGIGAGHIGGYGYLHDHAGNDSYDAIRIAIGAATVTGVGRFADDAGNDRYDYYSPRPLFPGVPNLNPGAGGVGDELTQCDRENRQLLGGGNVLGVGIFDDLGGDDSYDAPEHSLGFGGLGGAGSFTDDGGGADVYTGPGAAGRGNGVTLGPTGDNQGSFTDR
jgi:hypothetical protein